MAGCNLLQTLKDASYEAYIMFNSANGYWRELYYWYFWIAIYWQCESGIWIYQRSQGYSADAHAPQPVFQSWLYEGDTNLSCASKLVQNWLCNSVQHTIGGQQMAKYLHSPSLRFQLWQDEPCFYPISQLVHHLSETHVHGACRSIKLTSLKDLLEDFTISIFGQPIHG